MEWRDIKGYEGHYQVSDTGLVRSVDRIVVYKDGRKRIFNGKIIRLKYDHNGYPRVCLSKNNKGIEYYTHRLVAEAFIPNPLKLPQVNHKDEKPSNSNVDNLEWCDGKYNVRYSVAVKVSQYDLEGNLIKIWDCMQDIQNELGIPTSNIVMCCKKKQKSAKGYCWNYTSDGQFSNKTQLTQEERDKRNADNRKRYYEDHEATKEYKRKWYLSHLEKVREYHRRYYKSHYSKESVRTSK